MIRTAAGIAAGLILLLASPRSASAQDQALDALLFLGSSVDLGEAEDVQVRTLQLYRLPLSWRLRSLETDGWGFRLTFPVSLSAVRFEQAGGVGSFVKSLGILSVVPGVEFEFGLGRRGRLKPFVEAGLGRGTGGGGAEVLYGAGLRANLVASVDRATVRLGGGASHRRRPERGTAYLSYSTVEGGIDIQFPAGFSIGSKPGSLGVFFIARAFDGLEFARDTGQPIALRQQVEGGVSFSTDPDLRIWKIPLPWVGVGYQTGSGLSGIRVYSAFPF